MPTVHAASRQGMAHAEGAVTVCGIVAPAVSWDLAVGGLIQRCGVCVVGGEWLWKCPGGSSGADGSGNEKSEVW
jgi:hypothetical protein